ncbi:MAG: hypothetical protein ABEK00_00040 [Candidatus Nanohaloarchaea archaeon]
MTVSIKIQGSWINDLIQGLKGSISNKWRKASTLTVGVSAFLLTVFSSNPGYSMQMLSSGLKYWGIAFATSFTGVLMNIGYTGLILTLIFSILVGVTMTNTVIQLKMNRLSVDALGALPGFLAGGCASCGVGVLSLLGFGGVLASLPFQGNLLRAGGVVLLVVMIARTGNPDACKI